MSRNMIGFGVGVVAFLYVACSGGDGPYFEDDGRVLHVRMQAVVVADDDGSKQGSITPTQVQSWVDQANRSFEASDARIVIDFVADATGPDWAVIQNSHLNDLSSYGTAVAQANLEATRWPGKMVVFFRHANGDHPLSTGNGFSGPNYSFVAMPGDFYSTSVIVGQDQQLPKGWQSDGSFVDERGYIWVQNYNILTHEVGHFLGLDHPFPGSSDAHLSTLEKVKTYAAGHQTLENEGHPFDGDQLADTPPDAGTALFIAEGWDPCTAFPDGLSILPGVEVKPLRDNVMSYFVCDPVMYFTQDQVARMRQTLLGRANRIHLVRDQFEDQSMDEDEVAETIEAAEATLEVESVPDVCTYGTAHSP